MLRYGLYLLTATTLVQTLSPVCECLLAHSGALPQQRQRHVRESRSRKIITMHEMTVLDVRTQLECSMPTSVWMCLSS